MRVPEAQLLLRIGLGALVCALLVWAIVYEANPRVVDATGTSELSDDPFRASGPGKIRCGRRDCTAFTQVCCEIEHGKFCVDAKIGCPDAGWQLACDETADCDAGQKCCFEPLPYGRRQARCQEKCSRPNRQLCALDDECESKSCLNGAGCARTHPGRLKLPRKREP